MSSCGNCHGNHLGHPRRALELACTASNATFVICSGWMVDGGLLFDSSLASYASPMWAVPSVLCLNPQAFCKRSKGLQRISANPSTQYPSVACTDIFISIGKCLCELTMGSEVKSTQSTHTHTGYACQRPPNSILTNRKGCC